MTQQTIPPNAIQTHSGGYFDVFESGPDAIHLEDIAHSLSMQCRYNGHIRMFYSVAEHCVILSGWILRETGDRQMALEALLHDASEAYLCDIPRPFKRHLRDYHDLESRIEHAVALKFGLVYPWAPLIKEADTRILLDEKKVLMLHNQTYWPDMDGFKPLGVRILGLAPSEAKHLFLETFHYLTTKD